MKYPILSLTLSLLILSGCTGVSSAEADTSSHTAKPVIVAEDKKEPKVGKDVPELPMTRPPGMMVQTSKPIICQVGMATVENLQKQFGEQPFILAFEPLLTEAGQMNVPLSMWINTETGSFTIVQQLPNPKEQPMMCILSSGTIGKINTILLQKILFKEGKST
tara:strand:- start:202 stop:690 length:489 start_codon:yes stop_codon:yes gene_type:complete